MSAATAQKERAHFVAGIQMEVAEMANDAQLVIEKGWMARQTQHPIFWGKIGRTVGERELFENRARKHMFCCKFYKLVACGGNKNLGHDRNLDVSQPQLLRKWVSHVCPSANLQIHKYTNTILIVQPVNTNTIVCNQDTKICIWLVGSSYWSDSFFKMRRMRNPHWGSVGACCWERMRRRGLFTC